LFAFTREQQFEIDAWNAAARRLARDRTGFRNYELLILSRSIPSARLWLDGAMHAGISDCAAREATNTLYLDKRVFPAALQLPSEDTICALHVDRAVHVQRVLRESSRRRRSKRYSVRSTSDA